MRLIKRCLFVFGAIVLVLAVLVGMRQRREGGDPLVEFGLGAKLWNPELRGLPPKPEVQKP